jgi:hypothetical protein
VPVTCLMTPSWRSRASCRERVAGEQRPQVGAAQAGDAEAGSLQGREQALFDAAEKIEALEIAPVDGTRLGEPVERADAGREIVQTGSLSQRGRLPHISPAPSDGVRLRLQRINARESLLSLY